MIKKTTLVFCATIEKALFFSRLAKNQNNRFFLFLTSKYSTYVFLKKLGIKAFLLQDYILKPNKFNSTTNVSEIICLDVQSKSLPKKIALKQIKLFENGFLNFSEQYSFEEIILWNGSSSQGKLILDIATKKKIKKIIFENSNIEGKLFVDIEGVNAKSSLMNKNLIDYEGYDENKLNHFLMIYKKKKELNHIVYQAKKPKIRTVAIKNILFNIFSKYSLYEKQINYQNIQKYINNFYKIKFDNYNYLEEKYVFFPLQVSTDSQIIVNSRLTLIESLTYAMEKANELNLDLIIKPHPAEKNINLLKHINKLKQESKRIFILNDNTFRLIKNSELIITINSTIGIEAMMYYKPIIVLGNSFYKRYVSENILTKNDINLYNRFLYNYLFNILKDVNYFKSEQFFFLNLDEI